MTININELRRLAQAAVRPTTKEQWMQARLDLIAAANPAAISELLDRLEAAEKERDALRNEIACVKEVEFPRKAQAVADAWKGKCKRLEVERDALRAAIKASASSRNEEGAMACKSDDGLSDEALWAGIAVGMITPAHIARPTIAEQDQINAEAAIHSIYGVRLSDEALWQTIGNGMLTPAHIAQAVADGTIASAYIMQPAPSINEGVRKVTLGFRWESEAQHHIPTIEIEFDPVSPDSPNDAKGWQDRDRLASMLTPEAKP